MAATNFAACQVTPLKNVSAAQKCKASAVRSEVFGSSNSKSVFGEVACFRANSQPLSSSRTYALNVESNLFGRIGRVAKSYANSIVSSAEDPEKMLDQTVNEMQEDLVKMRQASAQVMASQKQLEAKYNQAQSTADDWYRRAQLALQKGDEELAKEALKRKKSFQENADGLKSQFAAQKAATDKLIGNTRLLEQKLSEAKSKKDTLKARAASAKTAQQVTDMVGGISTSSAMAAFDKMEEKVMQMEAEADASMAISSGDTLAAEFALLEADTVDDELAKMKKQLKGDVDESKKEIPSAKPVSDSIEAELEELRRKAREQ
ncbi:hypothetical protein CYMTET_13736 [Cymbomonas tetramitiformis]|uniref:Uncharacterized protein n=1 Tax=Cymbomonas tetramitiformis TaxID=36881 RepID=A0AAE0GI07_9CHLO|nr:hypothetical protein CYMTET_13736 [Cymbomonas tetramitiformis]